jgi:hypothetical protein
MTRFLPVSITLTALLACTAAHDESVAPAVVPVHDEFGLLFVEVDVPGHGPVLALFDTGANASAIDARVASHLPVAEMSQVVGTTGTIDVEMVVLAGLRVGPVALPALRASRRDLGGLLAPEGRTVGMILGSDAFLKRAVTIDFVARELAIAETASRGVPRGVSMIMDNGIPAIEGKIGGIDLWLRIDTGASLFDTPDVYVNIPTRVWTELCGRDASLTPTTHFQGTGADGQTVELPVAPIPNASVGPLEMDSVFVIVQPEAGYFADPDAKGFVSNNFLRKMGRVTLDYKERRLRPPTAPQVAP